MAPKTKLKKIRKCDNKLSIDDTIFFCKIEIFAFKKSETNGTQAIALLVNCRFRIFETLAGVFVVFKQTHKPLSAIPKFKNHKSNNAFFSAK